MDTPIVDKCAERGSDLGLANESWSRIWPTARSLERHARAMAEALDGLLSFARRRLPTGHYPPQGNLADEALAAFRAFEKENT